VSGTTVEVVGGTSATNSVNILSQNTTSWPDKNAVIIIIIVKKTQQFTTPFKDHIRQLADIKQQISQKMILHCSTSPKCHCAAK